MSVAIRRVVHPSWYGPAGERPSWLDRHSWTGTSYSHETGSRPTGLSFVYKYLLVPSRIDSNKQCFHNQFMHTCLLRATVVCSTRSPGYFLVGIVNNFALLLLGSGAVKLAMPNRAR